MLTPVDHSALVYPQRELDLGIRRQVYRGARNGEFLKLAPGVYVRRDTWNELGVDERYRLRVRAAWERAVPSDVLSHWSAAALWQLPILGRWPKDVHVVGSATSNSRSTSVLRRHTDSWAADPVDIDGMLLTALGRTVVDMARVARFPVAVAMGDAALWRAAHPRDAEGLAGVSLEELEELWSLLNHGRGFARARRVLDFIDGRANRPGESLSRVTMHALGVPTPELQHTVFGPTGRRYELDFYWPEFNVGAEFDGRAKYTDPRYLAGRTPDQAVYEEKRREDEIRPQLHGYGRWDWNVAGSEVALARRLRRIGVRW